MNVRTTVFLERFGDVDLDAEVNPNFIAASFLQPAEGGEIESLRATANGVEVELTQDELEDAEEAIFRRTQRDRRGWGREREWGEHRAGPLRRRYGHTAGGGMRWVRLAPLASVLTLGGGYLRSEDGRFVIFAQRFQGGTTGSRYSYNKYRTIEYLGGGGWGHGGGANNRELYDGQNLERAKAAADAILRGSS